MLFTEVTELHDRVRQRGLRWFEKMSQDMQTKILGTFGEMPAVEENWNTLENGPAWAWWLVAILPLGHHLQVISEILYIKFKKICCCYTNFLLDFIKLRSMRYNRNIDQHN